MGQNKNMLCNVQRAMKIQLFYSYNLENYDMFTKLNNILFVYIHLFCSLILSVKATILYSR